MLSFSNGDNRLYVRGKDLSIILSTIGKIYFDHYLSFGQSKATHGGLIARAERSWLEDCFKLASPSESDLPTFLLSES